jgi:hypothetical protein
MTKQSIFTTLTIAAMIPFASVMMNLASITLFGYGFLPECSGSVKTVCGFVCWTSFAVTTWVVYKVIESLTESY